MAQHQHVGELELTVTASNDSGESAAATAPQVRTRPAGLTVTATDDYRQFALSWTAPASATSYEVLWCTGATCTPATSPRLSQIVVRRDLNRQSTRATRRTGRGRGA